MDDLYKANLILNDIFVFDAGLKFASDKLLGVDYVIPNFDFQEM